MRSLRIYFTDGTGAEFNDKTVANYDRLEEWLTIDLNSPFKLEKMDGKIIVLYKHSLKFVEIFKPM
ncbi:hypothetical protein [Clostridium thermarum]|uniref:hypothetical protein n=1 Tax=Clostridium thermarum TaxID=1716543 RepID=UPI00111D10BF|nr:hypothetical protein [Clostridium thermarum]